MRLMEVLKSWLAGERGRSSALAKHLRVPSSNVARWLSGHRPIPVEHAAAIEQFTGGEVTRQDLFPAEWRRIWPELARRRTTPPTEAHHVN